MTVIRGDGQKIWMKIINKTNEEEFSLFLSMYNDWLPDDSFVLTHIKNIIS